MHPETTTATAHSTKPNTGWYALMAAVVLGLAASSLLMFDYLRPAPVFCSYDGGCDAIKHSAWASVLGVPTPVLGVLAFATFGLLAVVGGAGSRRLLVAISGLGAAAALFFVSIQFSLGRYCPYCLVADTATLLVFAIAAHRLIKKTAAPGSARLRGFAGLSMVVACAVPPFTGGFMKPSLPAAISAEQAKTPKGLVTVIDFVDFECPFCRMSHAELLPVIAAHRTQLRVVKKQVPLTRSHPHAMDAARAAACGEVLGKGAEMADLLFATPVEQLTVEGCERAATSLGLLRESYRACIADPTTDARIAADTAEFRASGGHGLPTFWIGAQKLEGAQDGTSFRNAVEEAIRRGGW